MSSHARLQLSHVKPRLLGPDTDQVAREMFSTVGAGTGLLYFT